MTLTPPPLPLNDAKDMANHLRGTGYFSDAQADALARAFVRFIGDIKVTKSDLAASRAEVLGEIRRAEAAIDGRLSREDSERADIASTVAARAERAVAETRSWMSECMARQTRWFLVALMVEAAVSVLLIKIIPPVYMP